jgi:hypothetical protein
MSRYSRHSYTNAVLLVNGSVCDIYIQVSSSHEICIQHYIFQFCSSRLLFSTYYNSLLKCSAQADWGPSFICSTCHRNVPSRATGNTVWDKIMLTENNKFWRRLLSILTQPSILFYWRQSYLSFRSAFKGPHTISEKDWFTLNKRTFIFSDTSHLLQICGY